MKKFYQKPKAEIVEIEAESLMALSNGPAIEPGSKADPNQGADVSELRSFFMDED